MRTGDQVTRLVIDTTDDPDLLDTDEPGKRPNGNDQQGYTMAEIDKQCDAIIQRHTGQTATSLRIVCGIDGCTTVIEGPTAQVLEQRDQHRQQHHPAFKARKRLPRFVKEPEKSIRDKQHEARENARKRFAKTAVAKPAVSKLPRGRQPHSRGVLLYEIRSFHQRHGRVPGERDLAARNGMPAYSCYTRGFGTLGNAIREAGLEPVKPGQYDRSKVKPRASAITGQIRGKGRAA